MIGVEMKINQMVGCIRAASLLAGLSDLSMEPEQAMPTSSKARKDGLEKPRRRAYLPAAERRKSIIVAAQEVFAKSNLQGARTRDIARAADVNQATIFEHFASKEALFEEAVVRPLIEAMRGMHERVEIYETADTAAEIAKLAHGSATRHIDDILQIFPLLTAALFSDIDLGKRLYQEHIAPLIAQRGEVLRPLLRDGLDDEFVGLANFGMLFAIAMDRVLGEKYADTGKLAEQFTRMSTGGFARERGR